MKLSLVGMKLNHPEYGNGVIVGTDESRKWYDIHYDNIKGSGAISEEQLKEILKEGNHEY